MKKEGSWENISYILGSKHRKNILKLLGNPKTPTQLKDETGLHFNSVSRTLNELVKKGFAECLNPKQKLIRFYKISTKGKSLLNDIEKLDKSK
ncbi:MAG: ArsR family transcriptional regulator [Nanoarchaeota archaeon]